MKNRTTKSALFTSVVSLVLCFAMLVGTTFAWFTDSAESKGNKIVAGTLDVKLLLWNGTEYVDISANTAPIFGEAGLAQDSLNTLWEPGKTQVAYLAIENVGSLDLEYKVNLNVTEYTQDFYKAMEYAITRDAANGTGVSEWTEGIAVKPGMNTTEATKVPLASGAIHYFALSVHMLEEAGNEYQGGSITFDVNVLATQLASESDSFNNQYDIAAGFPALASGHRIVDTTLPQQEFALYDTQPDDHNAQKFANVKVPTSAIKDPTQPVSATVIESESVDSRVVVTSEQKAVTFDVTVTNLRETNTDAVEVSIRIGKGYTGVRLFHNDVEITNFRYDPEIDEYITFWTNSFSPFTVVYDEVAKEIPAPSDNNVPKAEVTKITVTEPYEWKAGPNIDAYESDTQILDAVFKFVAPHTAETISNSEYKNWYCDYYVSVDANVPEYAIFLAGNYEGWGWVGFESPMAVEANTEIPLLETAMGGSSSWTYAEVVYTVGTFLCGVSVTDRWEALDPANSLDGVTFTVKLCLTNPETGERIAVNTVSYTFGGIAEDGTEYEAHLVIDGEVIY